MQQTPEQAPLVQPVSGACPDESPEPDAGIRYEIIVASTLDGWIGKPNGALPARQKADLAHFRKKTTGNVVIMGRKTLESIGCLLPNRLNVILTSQPFEVDYWLDGSGKQRVEDRRSGAPHPLIVSSFAELRRRLPEHMNPEQTAFVIGGASIYRQALEELPIAAIWRTRLQTTVEEASEDTGWARFDLPDNAVQVNDLGPYPSDEDNEFDYSYEVYSLR